MKPLKDIVVLDLTRVLAGPYCAMVLADYGCDVVKIEPPGEGDDSRAFGPFVGQESAYFMSLNRNKRSMTLNLKKQEARDLFKEMVKKADVVLENYRPGTMEKFGLGYDELKTVNPQIIYAACSGFGHTGPYAQKPGYDILAQAMGGIMSITGPEGGEPVRVGASIGDIIAGLFTAIGVLMALHHRTVTGEGQKIDVSMLDSQVAILENAIARYFVSGSAPKPLGTRHPSITPFDAFKSKDGSIIVGAGNDRLWEKLCDIIGCPELKADERFKSNSQRTQNFQELYPYLNDAFRAKTTAEWIIDLEAAGIPCGPINPIDKVVADPQVLCREMIVETDHPVAGPVKMAGVPIKMSATPGGVDKPAPTLGQHSAEILRELLGLKPEEIENLRKRQVL
ncbi:CaiB/BaiF CoA transferase family protein [Anaeroselena agilis]|uniref:CaiB/BaiF CoA-transferase family protein n=1 Tax=Anaeroselena agilis TaxID=3063788 RepID=A0ABU3NUV2_9FIRM|nr:CaiB/BaiF CoA-transferase family protein [Selenomonadales bacterium 4137-cl]